MSNRPSERITRFCLNGSWNWITLIGYWVAGDRPLGLGGLCGSNIACSCWIACPLLVWTNGCTFFRFNVLVDKGVEVSFLREQIEVVHNVRDVLRVVCLTHFLTTHFVLRSNLLGQIQRSRMASAILLVNWVRIGLAVFLGNRRRGASSTTVAARLVCDCFLSIYCRCLLWLSWGCMWIVDGCSNQVLGICKRLNLLLHIRNVQVIWVKNSSTNIFVRSDVTGIQKLSGLSCWWSLFAGLGRAATCSLLLFGGLGTRANKLWPGFWSSYRNGLVPSILFANYLVLIIFVGSFITSATTLFALVIPPAVDRSATTCSGIGRLFASVIFKDQLVGDWGFDLIVVVSVANLVLVGGGLGLGNLVRLLRFNSA